MLESCQKSGMYTTDIHMKTTLNLDDRILRAAKVRAAETGDTLTHLIESALRSHLASASAAGGDFRLQLLVKSGQPVPGVTFDDRDALYERMESRD